MTHALAIFIYLIFNTAYLTKIPHSGGGGMGFEGWE
jgi:hypothetical protein